MYHVLLTNRYLTSRVIPLIAVAAVALCVALIIIVVSVMTGFLDMVKSSGKTLIGDVVVSYPITGLPYYERLIERINALPEAHAATPIVDGYGILKMPYPAGDRKQSEQVHVWGVEPASLGEVTRYTDTLYWRPPTAEERERLEEDEFRREVSGAAGEGALEKLLEQGKTFRDEQDRDAVIVLGMHVSVGNERQRDGTYRPIFGPIGYWWMPRFDVQLTVVPIATQGGLLEPETRAFHVVNEFVSGVYMIDDTRVMIPITHAQEMLHLDAAEIVDDEGEETGFVDPARATMILVRASDGVEPDDLRSGVALAFAAYRDGLLDDPTVSDEVIPPAAGRGVLVQTWREQQRQFIDPIEKERDLMRVLFSIIYLVCAGLVLSIFWAIVQEKTRDIGILRSVGASRLGICAIFVRYGAIIGTSGSIVGIGLAYLVVTNINAIHDAMGESAPAWAWIGMAVIAAASFFVFITRVVKGPMLPIVLWGGATIVATGLAFGLAMHRGTLIWDPSVYYFNRIPNHLDVKSAWIAAVGAIVFSILGALVPAAKAADTDPVGALRYE